MQASRTGVACARRAGAEGRRDGHHSSASDVRHLPPTLDWPLGPGGRDAERDHDQDDWKHEDSVQGDCLDDGNCLGPGWLRPSEESSDLRAERQVG